MERHDYVHHLRVGGQHLAAAVEAVGLDAKVPTCPEWQVRDLLRHIGGVHRWATTIVTESLARPPKGERVKQIMQTWPDDDGLIEWFRAGHARLVDVLDEADPATECWSFLPAPSPVEFWARRQAHETAVHWMDVESARQGTASIPAALAVDGIEELFFGFFAKGAKQVTADWPRTLAVSAVDTGDAWLATIAPQGVDTERVGSEHAPGAAQCTVTGTAAQLYALLWNRRFAEGLAVTGDTSLLQLWRAKAQVTWD